jgi:hypothetical protein
MNAMLAWLSEPLRKVVFHSKPLPEPEPLRPAPRAMTGFLATLSAEQRKEALGYCGDDHHGERR